MATFRLRVVGVFYDQRITFNNPNPTIKDLLDEAVRQGGGTLTYASESRVSSASTRPAAPVRVIQSLVSFTHQLQQPLIPSLGQRQGRPAGRYTLPESVSVVGGSEIVHAWQYYVIRDTRAVSNAYDGDPAKSSDTVSPASPGSPAAPNATGGFTPFNEMPLQDGDEVIWRNVSIVRNPETAS